MLYNFWLLPVRIFIIIYHHHHLHILVIIATTTTTVTIIIVSVSFFFYLCPFFSPCSVADSLPLSNLEVPEAYVLCSFPFSHYTFSLGSLICRQGFMYQPLLVIPRSIILAQISLSSFEHYTLCPPDISPWMSQKLFKPKLNETPFSP